MKFTLVKPKRSPESIAIKEICQILKGEWLWKHDGTNVNGNIVLHEGGKVTSSNGWVGNEW